SRLRRLQAEGAGRSRRGGGEVMSLTLTLTLAKLAQPRRPLALLLPPLRGKGGKGGVAAPGASTKSLRSCRLRRCAPAGALPPFRLRLNSLCSLSLRCLPP